MSHHGAMDAYSEDLRQKIVEAVEQRRMSKSEAARAFGAAYLHHGTEALRELYAHMFANSGGIGLEHCTLTDAGVRCAIEFNCGGWVASDIPRQAGVAVYERGGSGLLSAARIYDGRRGTAGRLGHLHGLGRELPTCLTLVGSLVVCSR